ncbi:hypothetical protein F5Y16DRAFT_390392 [Xylariaceae sp. FL0255]|nr:hypothetical protein F5Y16DRAFT_390392 [Xylariaceae sp. FL0255]
MPTRSDYDSAGRVSAATTDDIGDLIPIFFEAFSSPAVSTTFPPTPSGHRWLERSFQNFLGQKSYYRPEARVPVVRNANGRVVSFAILHVVKPGQSAVGHSWKTRWSKADDLPNMSEEKLAGYFEPMAKAHHLVVGKEGHVFIELVITKKNQRHQGHASALMAYAANLADELDMPAYLDGGGRGMHICERAGFEPQDVERRYGGPPPCVPRLRPRRSGS